MFGTDAYRISRYRIWDDVVDSSGLLGYLIWGSDKSEVDDGWMEIWEGLVVYCQCLQGKVKNEIPSFGLPFLFFQF